MKTKMVKNIKYNCKPLFQKVKFKLKSPKISTVKNGESDKLMDAQVEMAGVQANFFHSLEELGPLQ